LVDYIVKFTVSGSEYRIGGFGDLLNDGVSQTRASGSKSCWRRRSVADLLVSPPMTAAYAGDSYRKNRSSSDLICWNGSTNTKHCPRCSENRLENSMNYHS
jgi:hypothetical protein